MAKRGSFFRRILHAVMPIIPVKPKPKRESPKERERERWIDTPPSGPTPPEPEPPSGRRPAYDPDSDTWRGISDRDWRRISDIADGQIVNGASFNADVELNWQARFASGDKATDLKAIIDALESGIVSADDMVKLLRYRERAANATARQQDSRMGISFWASRITNLPEELYWYQWGW